MPSDSARLHIPMDIRQYDDPAEPEPVVIPEEEPSPDDDASSRTHTDARLWRQDGKVMYQDAGMDKPESVRLLWARPLSGRGGPVSVVMAEKKKEVAYFPDLSALAGDSRTIATEELNAGMVMPVIRKIHQVNPRFGNYYWNVDTDMGPRTFLLMSPENNASRPGPDSVILKDVSGNCYEIASVAGLDPSSRHEMEKAL